MNLNCVQLVSTANKPLVQKINQLIGIKLRTLCPGWRYKQLLSKSTPHPGGTNSCFLKPSLRWRYKRLHSESTPYVGGTKSCFLNQPLRWWYVPTLQVHPTADDTDAADPYSAHEKKHLSTKKKNRNAKRHMNANTWGKTIIEILIYL